MHGSLIRGGCPGVLQEVDQDLLQGFAVGMDVRHVLRQVKVHGDVLLAHLTARVGHGIVNDKVQVHGFGLEVVESRFERGDLDQVVDQAIDPFGGGLDALHEFAL